MMVVRPWLRSSMILLLVLSAAFLSTCQQSNTTFSYEDDQYQLTRIGTMPEVVDEGSGLALANDSSMWTLNDGGGATELYKVSRTGKLLATLKLKGIENQDWEELAADSQGNLYIGDIGNNFNWRHDLTIYRVNPAQPDQTARIAFRYADQHDFPPDTKDRNFDCEAFVCFNDSLYLFSKNRGKRVVKLYAFPATPGKHVANILDTALLAPQTDDNFFDIQITGASLSADKKMLALLTYNGIFLFHIKNGQINFRYPWHAIKFYSDQLKQTEAICFINQTDFIFTNEQQSIFLARRKKGRSSQQANKKSLGE